MPEAREYLVVEGDAGERLDRVLARQWPDLSRARIQKLMQDGSVRLDDHPVRAKDVAVAGTLISVEIPEPEPSHIEGEPLDFSVVYEDESLLVVDKPAGLVVHPGAGNRSGTLVHGLVHRLPGLASVGGVDRPGIVHRLDKGTSGLMLVAKTDAAHRALSDALAAREIHRTYHCLAWDGPPEEEGRIEAPIGRHPRHRKKMAVLEGGRPAATRYRVLESYGWVSYVECELETGRTHQIRVHLAHLGSPLLCDPTYGGGNRRALNLPQSARRLADQVTRELLRPALHALRLEFSHPISGKAITIESELPADFAIALGLIRGGRPVSPIDPLQNRGG